MSKKISLGFSSRALTAGNTVRCAVAGALAAASMAVGAAGVTGMGTWQDTLQGRDLDGDLSNGYEAYYDTVLQITWLADAGYAMTSGYQPEYDGRLSWDDAVDWVESLSVYGVSGWRLPAAPPVNGVSYDESFSFDGSTDVGYNINSTSNELGHMFYVTLGNRGWFRPNGQAQGWAGLINTGPFANLPSDEGIWTGASYLESGSSMAWYFAPSYGYQESAPMESGMTAWAVKTGDVISPVPESSTWLMMTMGLLVIGAASRRFQV